MVNGSAVHMTDKEIAGKKGLIRGHTKDMKVIEDRLARIKKNLGRERNFEEFDACRDHLQEMTQQLGLLERDALPVQIWCPFCAWKPP